jgi:hypothetical protein
MTISTGISQRDAVNALERKEKPKSKRTLRLMSLKLPNKIALQLKLKIRHYLQVKLSAGKKFGKIKMIFMKSKRKRRAAPV